MSNDALKCSFLPLRLKDLDSVSGDLVVVSLFDDDRPPRGLAGLVDWRMDGMISRIRAATVYPRWSNPHIQALTLKPFPADFGGKLLFPVSKKLRYQWALVMALGDRRTYNSARFKDAVVNLLGSATSLGTNSVALQLPGWDAAGIPARRAVETLLGEWAVRRDRGENVPGQIVIFESLEHQREMHDRTVEMLEQDLKRPAMPTGPRG